MSDIVSLAAVVADCGQAAPLAAFYKSDVLMQVHQGHALCPAEVHVYQERWHAGGR